MKRLTILIIILWTLLPAMVCAQYQDTGQLYAVLVSGGRNKLTNHERYWNDCAFLYCTLRQTYRVPKRNIAVLMSDGGDVGRDMLRADGRGFMSMPTDLDGDGQADVSLSATQQNLESTINDLAHRLTANDRLLFYIVDHGGRDDSDGRPYLWLWSDEQLYSSHLADMLGKLQVGSLSILLGQCYSGAFMAGLQAPNRIVTTACSATEQSWSCPDRPYDEFVYHWTCAVAGHDENGLPIHADSDGDGQVSMAEAYDYARRQNRRPETPQFVSWPDELGRQWALGSLAADGAGHVLADEDVQTFWSLSGVRQTSLRRGLSVVRQNGKTRKIVR